MKSHFSNPIANLLFNILVALIVTICTGISATFTVPLFITAGVILGFIKHAKQHYPFVGYACNSILREIALPEIMSGFYPEGTWIGRARNMDSYVVADTINIAEAGVDPEVLVDNTTYPIEIEQREDANKVYKLSTLDTKNTHIPSVQAMLASYNLRQDIIRGHKASLLMTSLLKAAHAYAPASNSANTPVFATTGDATDIGGSNYKALKFADLIKMVKIAKEKNWLTKGGRLVCMLSAQHQADLMAEDLNKFKALLDITTYQMQRLFGIDFYDGGTNATYNRNTLAKKAYGAVAENTDSPAVSQFFIDNEVMRADGTYDMFIREKDPEYRGDIVGFQKRFVALPLRNQCIGAIVSVTA